AWAAFCVPQRAAAPGELPSKLGNFGREKGTFPHSADDPKGCYSLAPNGQGWCSVAHKWRFFRAGGVEQVQIQTGDDLAHLGELDQKLWVALACPVVGLGIEARSLALVDTDGDGRIRAQELISAAQWITGVLRDTKSLTL